LETQRLFVPAGDFAVFALVCPEMPRPSQYVVALSQLHSWMGSDHAVEVLDAIGAFCADMS
jgi:hypothetical protein